MGRHTTEVVCPEDLQLPGSDKRLKDAGSACKVQSIDVFSENGRERVGS